MTASMLGDVERRGRTEADHILGDLLRRRGGVWPGTAPAPGGLHRGQGCGGPGGRESGRKGVVIPHDPSPITSCGGSERS